MGTGWQFVQKIRHRLRLSRKWFRESAVPTKKAHIGLERLEDRSIPTVGASVGMLLIDESLPAIIGADTVMHEIDQSYEPTLSDLNNSVDDRPSHDDRVWLEPFNREPTYQHERFPGGDVYRSPALALPLNREPTSPNERSPGDDLYRSPATTLTPPVEDGLHRNPSSATAGTTSQSAPAAASSIVAQTTKITPIAVIPSEPASPAFRIVRSPVEPTTMEVSYRLTRFGDGTPTSHERVAVFAPGAASVQVSDGFSADRAQVVTLRVLQGNYVSLRTTASLFPAGDPHACSDRVLVAAYRGEQSPEAFALLVERHRALVLQTCYRLLGNWHDAEDVSQNVFVALGTRAIRWQSSLAGWLVTVAHHASIALVRSRNRRARHESKAARAERIEAPDNMGLNEEIEKALRQIRPPLREAVRLRYLEGYSQSEAARRLGCPRGTLSRRASEGLRALREILTEISEH